MGKRSVRRAAAVVLVGLAVVGPAACGTETRTRTVAATPTTTAPPPPPPPVYWPLTGLESGEVPVRPALAVKIENSVTARPQTGLGSADMVWEEVVEGGITRFVAVYHSTLPTRIGPVRSVRPMDPAIVAPLRGLLAFSGGQRPFVQAVGDAGLQVISNDAGARGFFRLDSRKAPHNVYAEPETFLTQADAAHQAAPVAQFRFAVPGEQPVAVTSGTPATSLDLKLSPVSRPRWTWSARDDAWLRAEGSTPSTEADGSPLEATNVVVLRVAVDNSTGFTDPAGNPVPETQLIGSGEALVATGGHTVTATWSKPSLAAPVVLTGGVGWPVTLAPGTTWVELVPTATGSVAVG